MTLEAIKFKNGKLEILDQLQLPFTTCYIPIDTIQDAWIAINEMKVRGAPAIAITGVLGVAVQLFKNKYENISELKKFTFESLDYLVTSRPTAVNMADAAIKIKDFCNQLELQIKDTNEYQNK